MAHLNEADQDLRGLLTRQIAELGRAPDLATLAAAHGAGLGATEAALRRLHDAKALLLYPGGCLPWAVHPFALSPGSCWVETAECGYWANCLYCGFGIAAALGKDAQITTRLGAEGETAIYRIRSGKLINADGVFHLSVPVRQWWDNVIHACASFQPFADEQDVAPWCERHGFPVGHVFSLEALWRFACDWYGRYLEIPWRTRTSQEVQELFVRHGLAGDFWQL
jgi:hypothetical protein